LIGDDAVWIAVDIEDSLGYYICKFFSVDILFTRDIGAQLSESVYNDQNRVINFFLKFAWRQVRDEVYG
jgi:hypothetical protein